MKRTKFLISLISLSFIIAFNSNAKEQPNLSSTPYWYISAGYESPFMSGDMHSITKNKFNFGIGPNIRVGYRFNPVFGLEVKGLYGIMTGNSSQYSKQYWLGNDGMTYYPYTLIDGSVYTPEFDPNNPNANSDENTFFGVWNQKYIGINGNRYANVFSRTKFLQFGLLGTINLNRLFFMDLPKNREQRFTLFFKPALYYNKYYASVFNSKSKKKVVPDYSSNFSIRSFSLGAELALNWAISKRFGLEIYSGAMWVTDKKFDAIRTVKLAKDDFVYSIGANLSVKFASKKRQSIIEDKTFVPVVEQKVEPIVYDNFVISPFIPVVQVQKEQTIKENAHFQFKLSSIILYPNLALNQVYFDRLDKIYNSLNNDPNIDIKNIVVEGFASPEGPLKNNIYLADNRAKAIVDFLKDEYHYSNIFFEGKGENWDGLRTALQKAEFDGKDKLLSIVNSDLSAQQKKVALRKTGALYRKALKEIYPALRMNTVSFTYVIKPYSLEQCTELFNSQPYKLSADEMIAVINQFPIYSYDFNFHLDKAFAFFPNDSRLIAYKAAALLKKNSPNEALAFLNKADINNDYILSLLGVAHLQLGNKDLALKFLNDAAEKGNLDAKQNLEIFNLQK